LTWFTKPSYDERSPTASISRGVFASATWGRGLKFNNKKLDPAVFAAYGWKAQPVFGKAAGLESGESMVFPRSLDTF
jgi:hypothetical protein